MSDLLIITGASSGIGAATALHFKQAGWNVINVSRSPANIEGCVSLTCDLLKPIPPEIYKTLLVACEESERMAVVHNAHQLTKNSLQTVTETELEHALQFAVQVPIALNQHLIPKMKPGSSIIYIGSTLSELAVKNTMAYVVAKHAMLGLMRASCQDLDATGIHTALIGPGFTETEMLINHIGEDRDIYQALADRSALHRLIQPKEIAELIYFAVTHPVINGSLLHANLGQLTQ